MALDADEQRTLRAHAEACALARIEGRAPPPPPRDPSPDLASPRGVFVTATVDGALRGCLGATVCPEGLLAAAGRLAADAVSHDPRFPPIAPDEVDGLALEIAVLGPLEPVAGPEDVVVGRHGVVVRLGDRVGLLLPQVAPRQGWDAHRLVAEAARKGGIPVAWLSRAQIEVFETDRL